MKREIKFRAWDKENGCWVSIDSVALCDDGSIAYLLSEEDDMPPYSEDEVEIMQFTGLKDKNGREIYEGDVLDIGLLNQDGNPVLAPVSYEAYLAGYVLYNEGHGIWQRIGGGCEVIGNIFENPELLEADK